MPRPPVRKTLKLAKAAKEGEVIGEYYGKAHIRKMQHYIPNKIIDILETWIKNIDLIELVVWGGSTIFIYNTLKTLDLVTARVAAVVATAGREWWKGIISPALYMWQAYAYFVAPTEEVKKIEKEIFEGFDRNNLLLLCLSMLIAYMLVKHGGQLLGLFQEGAGSLGNIALALLK